MVDETQRLHTASMEDNCSDMTDQQKQIVDEFEEEDELKTENLKRRKKPKPSMAELEGDEDEEGNKLY